MYGPLLIEAVQPQGKGRYSVVCRSEDGEEVRFVVRAADQKDDGVLYVDQARTRWERVTDGDL